MQKESEKQPTGKGPMAEIDFWRQRNAVLSCLCEQLQLSHVRTVIEVVKTGTSDKNLIATFTNQVSPSAVRQHDSMTDGGASGSFVTACGWVMQGE